MTIQFTHPGAAPLALNRRESLLDYLTRPISPVAALTRPDYDAMPAPERAEFDRARIAYLSGGLVVVTPTIQDCKTVLTRAFAANSARNSGHAGVMLTGDSTMGKTTAAKTLMRWVVDQYSLQFPGWRAADHIPVVYIEVPAAANGKTLMRVFAEFLGLAVLPRETADELRVKVVAALRRANTQVIVVDELHNLAGRTAGVGEASDILKGLSNDLTATFLYAGIDLTAQGFMSGLRGQQLTRRFTAVPMVKYEWANPDDRKTWKRIVATFEKLCPLIDNAPGTLDPLAEYLHQRTDGSIGALSRLLTGTAIDLISAGEGAPEEFTEDALDQYALDYSSEAHYRRRNLPTVSARRPKAATKPKQRQANESPAVDAAKRALMEQVNGR
ncbi:TniB family NTP-binding protein [Microbacterium terricola]|uniref:AAA family ATPase n=1 Tax=Microbacterium terricola TaxID=344163 RepID=A0ABM8E2Q9_9MICO|nr:TniB family NTP-binding protein [Microbacterium terricola]UYK40052.1 TniB family NTP-binding protein [Microbacterium terricola]BDV32253.1 hypothetical protein Microterr_29130 [Microbacterium terricola]